MKQLTREMQRRLYNIEKVKTELSKYLEASIITEKDIFCLLKKDMNFGVRYLDSSNNPKEKMLKNIFNCPFLLCDQKLISNDIKELLPYFLRARYETEKETLRVYFEQSFIDENEYKEELENLKFFYYESSNDGRCILETGHAFFENQKLKAR